MKTQTEILAHPLIYVTRDIERALGMEPALNYFIITNSTPYSEKIAAKYPNNVWLVGNGALLETHEILALPEVIASITKSTKEQNASVLVFKNMKKIETICAEHGWNLVNPSAELAEKIENKMSQIEWLGELGALLPKHEIIKVRDIGVEGAKMPFILQWAHSHTGDGTILVSSKKQLTEITAKFPDREARVSTYINGPTFTANVIAMPAEKFCEPNISYQITGALPFTENPWSTIGNDWSLTHSLLTEKNIGDVTEMARAVGARMYAAGWRGLFGIDVIYDIERDSIHLIEINARQPASTTFESQLQLGLRVAGIEGNTTFENHLIATASHNVDKTKFSDVSISPIIPIADGSQIIQRLTTKTTSIKPDISDKLDAAGFITIPYTNTTPNADLLRIQHLYGIMETHTKFNKRGKQIIEIL